MRVLEGWACAVVLLGTTVALADDEKRGEEGANAAPPRAAAETLVPAETKSFVSFPDFDELRAAWKQTQFGKLANDPLMRPFFEGLDEQIDEKLTQTGNRLGVTWKDLREVYSGEICIASIQPPAENAKAKAMENYALAILVDVTGRKAQVEALLGKIDADMAARQAEQSSIKVGGAPARVYQLPRQRGQRAGTKSIVLVHKDWLLASDHEQMISDIVARIDGRTAPPALDSVPEFGQVLTKSAEAAAGAPIHIRFFVEPFGMAEVAKAARRAGRRPRRNSSNRLQAFQNQGFDSIQGFGGQVSFASGGQDLLYHLHVACPEKKRVAAAAMLDFPNDGGAPLPWTPADTGSVAVINWRLLKAFKSIEPLANELLGDDVWEEILLSIEQDRNGPQINLERDLIAHMDERVYVISDIAKPIGPDSERICVAIALKNVEAATATIKKAFEDDPMVKPKLHRGNTIYEIRAPQANDRLLNNISVTVDHGYILAASHTEYLMALMDRKADGAFIATEEFKSVEKALGKLGANTEAFRGFVDLGRTTEANYELIRANKLPEANTLLAQLLNNIWPTSDPAVKRKPRLDGSQLPPFAAVKDFFKPGGFFIRSDNSGWMIIGTVLP